MCEIECSMLTEGLSKKDYLDNVNGISQKALDISAALSANILAAKRFSVLLETGEDSPSFFYDELVKITEDSVDVPTALEPVIFTMLNKGFECDHNFSDEVRRAGLEAEHAWNMQLENISQYHENKSDLDMLGYDFLTKRIHEIRKWGKVGSYISYGKRQQLITFDKIIELLDVDNNAAGYLLLKEAFSFKNDVMPVSLEKILLSKGSDLLTLDIIINSIVGFSYESSNTRRNLRHLSNHYFEKLNEEVNVSERSVMTSVKEVLNVNLS